MTWLPQFEQRPMHSSDVASEVNNLPKFAILTSLIEEIAIHACIESSLVGLDMNSIKTRIY